MIFGVVNKSTNLNRFVLHTLQRNITHLAVITRKRNITLGILKGGGGGELEKSRIVVSYELSPLTNCRLLRIVASYELSPLTNCRLLRIVASYELSPLTTCRLLRIVAFYELSPLTNCRL